jgi:methylase of polypeptide subunit release factors
VNDPEAGLSALLDALAGAGYRFTAVTPETHRRVLDRAGDREAADLRDVFGWNLPFADGLLLPRLQAALEASGTIRRDAGLWRSRVRVASLDDALFLHSAFPTDEADAVFFGPDSYRFVRFLRAEIPLLPPARRVADIGTGSGVGAVAAARLLPEARVSASDINAEALLYARINARHAGVALETAEAPGVEGLGGEIDLAIANPPFVADAAGRLYRDGGGRHGAGVSIDWALAAARRIAPGGTVLLYTGSAIVEGRDDLRDSLAARLPAFGCTLRYEEIDPDIFGELLAEPAYAQVERIAAVGAVIGKPRLESPGGPC